MRIKSITGIRRVVFDIYMAIYLFLKYTYSLFSGKISFKQWILLFKRMSLLYLRFRHNKIIKIGKVYKLHLYLPAFPTKAFFYALNKFLIVEGDPPPVSVLLSTTKACVYNCPHCYQKYDKGEDLPLGRLLKVTKQIQNIGVAFFNIEGGEPLLKFERLLRLVECLDERAEIWVNTTGFGLTEEKAKKLKKAGVFGAMISLHHWNREEFDKFVGKRGAFEIALTALRIFQKVGITTAINCCPSKEMIESGGIEKIMELAKNYRCSYVQIIHGKPAGGWMGRNDSLDKVCLEKLYQSHILYNKHFKYKDYPAVSSQVFESAKRNFGCTAGGIERFYVNHHGEVQPCEFLNVSFGNVQNEDFLVIFKRMRTYFKTPGTNWLCCTEAGKISEVIKNKQEIKTPLPKEITMSLIDNWDKGEKTPLYRKMKLYESS